MERLHSSKCSMLEQQPNDPVLSEDMLYSWFLQPNDIPAPKHPNDLTPMYNRNSQPPPASTLLERDTSCSPSHGMGSLDHSDYPVMENNSRLPLLTFYMPEELDYECGSSSSEIISPNNMKFVEVKRDVDATASIPSSPASETDSYGNSSDSRLRTRKRRTLTPAEEADRTRRRLERNRESARQCRLRKTEHIASLEFQIEKLKLENSNLRNKLKSQNGVEEQTQVSNDMKQLMDRMEDLLLEETDVDGLNQLINTYKIQSTQSGKDRENAVRFHSQQIETLLMPTQVEKLAFFAVESANDVDESNNNGTSKGIWRVISKELQFSEEQSRKLNEMQERARQLRVAFKDSMHMVKDFNRNIAKCNESLEHQMGDLHRILNPLQSAKLILWAQKNPRYMQMLNSVWKNSL